MRQRLASLTGREKVFLLAGAGSIALLIPYLVMPAAAPVGESVELVEAPPPPSSIASPPPAIEATAPPATLVTIPDGLMLRSVFGGGPRGGVAIFRLPDGQERLVRMGREAIPGLVLKEIGISHALLSGAGGDLRLNLGRAGTVKFASTDQPDAGSVMAAEAGAAVPQDRRHEILNYRLGLEPRKAGGRIAGFAIRPEARLPVLQQAGLRPGDILVAVNGQPFESGEKVLELPQEIAGSYTAEFEFIRGGRRMKASLEVNKRPA